MEQNLFRVPLFHFTPEKFLATARAKQRKPEYTGTDSCAQAIASNYSSNNTETVRLPLTAPRPRRLVSLGPAGETALTSSGHRCLPMTESKTQISRTCMYCGNREQVSVLLKHPTSLPTHCPLYKRSLLPRRPLLWLR